ncbi:aldehyde dehydrogenase family protein [Leptothermofonsia sichuanensis E412]|uniref:L-piperidine-6-carboxylate dehydrogenase n=1 Tax=Leptothermofonsia sichuanensis TaxID=2917832 RepID=UPI001CA6B329|nr:aldehyde dehydrogenase family protein [Leptothermofonsia sichuanensis]QZZ19988.1 aldehyde dehydrogenase family protein [Leptothermofonsia sichuanensis E412]
MTSNLTNPATAPDLAELGLEPLDRERKHPGLRIGNQKEWGNGDTLALTTPIDGTRIGYVQLATAENVNQAVAAAHQAYLDWRLVPAPRRGELVRRIAEQVRQHQSALAQLITLEVGKIPAEAAGEVQEWIDLCDFGVGLSRQLYGLTIASERPSHRLMEQWHPLGAIGVITAFNFPVAVWAWNAMIALVCGNTVVWKPSEKTPLCALACHHLVQQAIATMPDIPQNLCSVVSGKADVGQALAAHPQLPLISATGSVAMGRAVATTVAQRLGRTILELGGNNGMVVTPSADLDLAIRAIAFAAVGTCGQRCTTLRRLIVHHSIADRLLQRLRKVYQSLVIGDPTKPGVLVGPLIDEPAYNRMQEALEQARQQGGVVYGGERLQEKVPAGGFYVQPAIVQISPDAPIVQEETFAPILYLMTYDRLETAIALHNGVPQGLSSAIFTEQLQEAEWFLSAAGSDCGIVNVNLGTSGAEIGGAFGGEKATGGGRESGSDAWKGYMRRVTTTINYGHALPLAQGIRFDVEG